VIQEVGTDGKPFNNRTYTTTVCTDRTEQFGAIRTGKRVPIITGALHGTTGDSKLEFQYQYLDVGVSIDTRDVREVGRQLSFNLKAEISSLADTAPSSGSELTKDPVIRQNSWQASVIIPTGKPTVVFSSDALDSKGGMQLLATATLLQ
jgi:type II secretory pathway component GspD/PulD (secretin)